MVPNDKKKKKRKGSPSLSVSVNGRMICFRQQGEANFTHRKNFCHGLCQKTNQPVRFLAPLRPAYSLYSLYSLQPTAYSYSVHP